MALKVSLSPLENAILNQLEEAGAEDLTVVLNSLQGLVSSPGGFEDSLRQFENAFRRLQSLGFVELVFSDLPGYPGVPVERASELLGLRSWIVWEPNGAYWKRIAGTKNIAVARTRLHS